MEVGKRKAANTVNIPRACFDGIEKGRFRSRMSRGILSAKRAGQGWRTGILPKTAWRKVWHFETRVRALRRAERAATILQLTL